jgi:hypothetical protein
MRHHITQPDYDYTSAVALYWPEVYVIPPLAILFICWIWRWTEFHDYSSPSDFFLRDMAPIAYLVITLVGMSLYATRKRTRATILERNAAATPMEGTSV